MVILHTPPQSADPSATGLPLVVLRGEHRYDLSVRWGVNLRDTLLALGLSPYTRITRRLNCGGRGLCATCGVWIEQGAPQPTHWHDALAARAGYPRLSCQIAVQHPMTVRLLTDKLIWGARDPARRLMPANRQPPPVVSDEEQCSPWGEKESR